MVLWSHHVVTAAIKEYLMRYENDIIHFLLSSRNCKKRFNQTLKALCSEHSVLLFLRTEDRTVTCDDGWTVDPGRLVSWSVDE